MKAVGTVLPALWAGHEAPSPCKGQQAHALQLEEPARPAVSIRWRGLLLACALHCCVLALCLWERDADVLANGDPVCMVTLVGFSGSGGQAAAAELGPPAQSPVVQDRQQALPAASQQAEARTLHKPEPAERPLPVEQRKESTPVKQRKRPQEQKPAATTASPQKTPRTRAKPADDTSTQKPAQAAVQAAADRQPGSQQGAGHNVSGQAATQGAGEGSAGSKTGQGGAYAPGDLDHPPTLLRRVRPEYPPEAKKKKIEGRVLVRLIVDSKGLPTQCSVHSAMPPGHFEAAALEAARRMRFAPGKKDGRAVRTLVLLPFDFRLR